MTSPLFPDVVSHELRCQVVHQRRNGIACSAAISACGRYRYWLRRAWPEGNGKVVAWLMLNPSTADAVEDDPTIRRCIAFTHAWGYSVLHVRNLFALRATDPAELKTAADPVGPGNDTHLLNATAADVVVVAWGAKVPCERDREVLKLLAGTPLYCLGVTKDGYPRHPLYVRSAQPLVPFPGGNT